MQLHEFQNIYTYNTCNDACMCAYLIQWHHWWDSRCVRDEKCADTSVINGIARYSKVLASTGSSSARFSSVRSAWPEWNRVEPRAKRAAAGPVYLRSTRVARVESIVNNSAVIHNRTVCVYGISGDKLRQKHMHTSNYGHNGVPSVSRYAATLHKQRSRLHLGVLGVLPAKSRGAATDLGCDKGTEGPGYLANTHNAGKHSYQTIPSTWFAPARFCSRFGERYVNERKSFWFYILFFIQGCITYISEII